MVSSILPSAQQRYNNNVLMEGNSSITDTHRQQTVFVRRHGMNSRFTEIFCLLTNMYGGVYLHETTPDILSSLQSWRMFSEIHPLKKIAPYHSQIKKGKFEETVYSILLQQNCKCFTLFLLFQMLGCKIQSSFQFWYSEAAKKRQRICSFPNSKEDLGF